MSIKNYQRKLLYFTNQMAKLRKRKQSSSAAPLNQKSSFLRSGKVFKMTQYTAGGQRKPSSPRTTSQSVPPQAHLSTAAPMVSHRSRNDKKTPKTKVKSEVHSPTPHGSQPSSSTSAIVKTEPRSRSASQDPAVSSSDLGSDVMRARMNEANTYLRSLPTSILDTSAEEFVDIFFKVKGILRPNESE